MEYITMTTLISLSYKSQSKMAANQSILHHRRAILFGEGSSGGKERFPTPSYSPKDVQRTPAIPPKNKQNSPRVKRRRRTKNGERLAFRAMAKREGGRSPSARTAGRCGWRRGAPQEQMPALRSGHTRSPAPSGPSRGGRDQAGPALLAPQSLDVPSVPCSAVPFFLSVCLSVSVSFYLISQSVSQSTKAPPFFSFLLLEERRKKRPPEGGGKERTLFPP